MKDTEYDVFDQLLEGAPVDEPATEEGFDTNESFDTTESADAQDNTQESAQPTEETSGAHNGGIPVE